MTSIYIKTEEYSSMENSTPIYDSLYKKKVIVTGGATGIGSYITRYFYEQGSQVFVLDIKKKESIDLVESLPNTKTKIKPEIYYCDLIDINSIEEVFKNIYTQFGYLDVLCNNAADDERHDWEKISSSEWDYFQNINLKSQFFCIREFSKYVSFNNGSSIICMGSISYLNGSTEMPSYTTAKSGIVGLVNTMANILGKKGIRINLIQPGWVMTEKQLSKWIDKKAEEMIEENQLLEGRISPDEPAKLVLFLASDQSKMITKQIINLDGGWV